MWKLSFERSKEVLLNTGDEISKKYVANFIVDYLNINDTTAKLFNLNISDSAREKKFWFYIIQETNENFIIVKKRKKKIIFNLKGENAVLFISSFFLIVYIFLMSCLWSEYFFLCHVCYFAILFFSLIFRTVLISM